MGNLDPAHSPSSSAATTTPAGSGRSAAPSPCARRLPGRSPAEHLTAAAAEHPWTGARFAAAWGSRDVLDAVLVRPELVAEISADRAVDHGGVFRHPLRFKRLRLDARHGGGHAGVRSRAGRGHSVSEPVRACHAADSAGSPGLHSPSAQKRSSSRRASAVPVRLSGPGPPSPKCGACVTGQPVDAASVQACVQAPGSGVDGQGSYVVPSQFGFTGRGATRGCPASHYRSLPPARPARWRGERLGGCGVLAPAARPGSG